MLIESVNNAMDGINENNMAIERVKDGTTRDHPYYYREHRRASLYSGIASHHLTSPPIAVDENENGSKQSQNQRKL
jgi:hypothetical protein